MIAWLYWDPQKVVFTIPLIDRPVVWYGLLFVFGFIVGYFIMLSMFKEKLRQTTKLSPKEISQQAFTLLDRLTWFVVAGAIIGARLGHVLFYDWPRYKDHLFDIVKVWEGGLASHGGAIAILLALFIYQRMINKKFPAFTFVALLDMITVPTAFAGCCIRIGNFINQEVVGNSTTVPWAVIFGHPADGGAPLPRHPVQLYEAVFYLLTFFLLFSLWKFKGNKLRPGIISGLFFILVFGSRVIFDFFKAPQSLIIDETSFQMGQYLSVPFILLGLILLFYGNRLAAPKALT